MYIYIYVFFSSLIVYLLDYILILILYDYTISCNSACQRGLNVKEAATGLWGDIGSRPEGPVRNPGGHGKEGNMT